MDSAFTVGVDLGGTKLATALVDIEGNIAATGRGSTGPQADPSAVIADIVASVREASATVVGERILAVGVGAAGQIDPTTGTIRSSPNLGWENVPLQSELERALGIPVLVANDVQAAAWGEWRHGAGQGMADIVCLFVGTGIGGGVIAAGHLLVGCGGSAGELGHTIIDRNGPPCRCGNHGCLEALAGGWAIGQRAKEAVATDPGAGAALVALAEGKSENLTAALVAEAAHQSDPLAQRLVAESGEALAVGVASIVNAFNPCVVILGGGVIEGLPELVQTVKEGVLQRALAAAAEQVSIVKAALGGHAGVIGAAAMARERFSST